MVNIFAREITDDLASLVKQIEKVVAENQGQKMAGFVVILTEDQDAAEPKLQELAKKHSIENVPLTTFDGTAGPKNYKIPEDAAVTVLMWRKQTVEVNHTFEKGKLDKAAIEKVVADTKKILE